MRQLLVLLLFCISSNTSAREVQLPDPVTLERLKAGEVILETTRTDESGGAAKIVVFIQAPVEAIWDVIYSCENAFIFLEGLKLCEVLEQTSDYTVTRQVVKKGWLIPTQDYSFRTVQEPFKHAEFRLVDGNLKAMEGSWDFIAMPGQLMRKGMPEMIACMRALADGSVNADMKARDLAKCPGN